MRDLTNVTHWTEEDEAAYLRGPRICRTCREVHYATKLSSPDPDRWCSYECCEHEWPILFVSDTDIRKDSR